MCIFSGDIAAVFGTKIFASSSVKGTQFLVYSMGYAADLDLAMILPLPTPITSHEDAVRFIDLSDYSDFFADISRGFDYNRSRSRSQSTLSQSRLQVHEVGNFEASFVPNRRDFVRLDERFRLPEDVWDQLPAYWDYGFAVFKLKSGEKDVHPMAFEFPRRDTTTLFFPTVHVHHGKVEPRANFNHLLYFQSQSQYRNWKSSENHTGILAARHFVNVSKTQGIVAPDLPIQKLRIYGVETNRDILVSGAT